LTRRLTPAETNLLISFEVRENTMIVAPRNRVREAMTWDSQY
jgi:hypothetical protein